jgi:alkylation response protein AidB-like acyl-CoA dehydrogenase
VAASPNELVQRARALNPSLEQGAFETITNQHALDRNIEALQTAGLFKVLLPQHYGGFELSLHSYLDTTEELAVACGSTSWVTAVYQAHAWLMALFPEAAQDDVYAGKPDNVLSGVLNPRGTAESVATGYRVSGFYPFCSGCYHADWLMFGAAVKDDNGAVVNAGIFLMQPDEVTIKDDWDVGGLAGTGSNSVIVDGIIVPEHRILWFPQAADGKSPGLELHQSPLYRNALLPALTIFLTGPAIGMARGACERFIASLPGREMSGLDNTMQSEMAATHLEIAEAQTKTDTARLLIRGCIDEMHKAALTDVVMAPKARAKIRMDCSYAMRLCLEATEALYIATGGRGLSNQSRIQQAARDLHAINMHALFQLKTSQEIYGRFLLDLPPLSPLI